MLVAVPWIGLLLNPSAMIHLAGFTPALVLLLRAAIIAEMRGTNAAIAGVTGA